MFGDKQARRDARRYRTKGLDDAARWMVDAVVAAGVDGASVLEIGGGVGAIQLELLKAGAESTVNVELSSGYEGEAARLAEEVGLAGRSERRIGDAVEDAELGEADVVVMHRVVCCYPDYERLVGTAARRARRTLVFTHPPGHVVARCAMAVATLWQRLVGGGVAAYAHPPSAMAEVARAHGLEPIARRRQGIWHGDAFARP
jgi:16S rRNA G966 N2-methylase RsmD